MIIDCHGHYTVDQIDWVSAADKRKIFEGNARRVFSRFKSGSAA